MLTFDKTLLMVTVMIVAFGGNIITCKVIYEGNTCSLPGGKLAVCTKLPDCKSIDNGLKTNTISFKSIVHCSFIGNIIVICCPDRTPTDIQSTTPSYTRTSGGFVFVGNVNRKDRNRLFLPNLVSTTREPKVLFTIKNITITDDVEYIDLTQLLKGRRNDLETSSPTSSSHHPFMLSSLAPQIVGKLTLDQTLSNNNLNIENFNNFNHRPTTTANSINNWNQHSSEFNNNDQTNNKNEKLRDRESRESQSAEQKFDYQNGPTTMKSTIDDPWAAFEFRPSAPVLTTPVPFSNAVQFTTQRLAGEQFPFGSAKSSFLYPSSGSLENNKNQKFQTSNNNIDYESTTTFPRHRDYESTTTFPRQREIDNNNLDPWMKDALSSNSHQHNANSNHNFGNSDHWTWHTTTTTTSRPLFNSWSTSNQNSGQWSTSNQNSDNWSTSIQNPNKLDKFSSLHSHNNLPPTSTTSISSSSSLDPWMVDAIQFAQLSSSTTTTTSPNNLAFSNNKRPFWGSQSEIDEEDTSSTPSSRAGGRKVISACERYKKNLGPRLDFHIIDGEPTKPGEFPHMAGIGYREFDTDEYTWDCGGSLISDSYILTAAHCCDNPKRQPKIIRLGKTTIRNNDDGAEAVDVPITKINIHPQYRSSSKYHDIALIQLAKSLEFTDDVAPACLYASRDDIKESVVVVATGWGVNDVQNRTQSNFLLKVNLTSNPLNNCNQSYYDYGFTRQYSTGLIPGQMCAYDPKFNKDSCQGDSGGPLQILEDTIHLSTIVGLTSFGIGCASAIPSVYTRVAFYLDWIESIVWP